jgi:transcriptional regulator with GAF, ATPase, and Fis domain
MVMRGSGGQRVAYRLHAAMTQTENLQEALTAIAAAARDAIEGCHSIGVALSDDPRPKTVATVGPFASWLDDAQHVELLGPSILAVETNEPVVVPRIEECRDEWPAFAQKAEELGVRSALSTPLTVDDGPFASLNMYATDEATFTDATLDSVAPLSVEVALAVHNTTAYWEAQTEVQHLHRALETRDVIGQAKGVLMERSRITSDEAFTQLRECARRRGSKLRQIAEHVAVTGELPQELSA